jgi:hypothetical protein
MEGCSISVGDTLCLNTICLVCRLYTESITGCIINNICNQSTCVFRIQM